MAKTAVQNPRHWSGPALEKDTRVCVASSTWKAGQFGYYDSDGLAAVCATSATKVDFQFSSTRSDTSTSTSVLVEEIPSASTRFMGYVSTGDGDTAAPRTRIDEQAGLHVGSNVGTVDVLNDTNLVFKIDDVLWAKEDYQAASTDDPGQVIFHVLQSVLDAT